MKTRIINKRTFALLALLGLGGSARAVTFDVVDQNITGQVRWTSDTVYILPTIIYVETGATLSIEPGTIIRGIDTDQAGDGVDPAARPGGLIVAQGGKIIANGTPDRPIIFTSIDDPNVPGGTDTVPGSFVNAVGRNLVLNTDYGDGTETGFGGALLDYTNAPYSINRRWSGLILLGRGYVGANTVPNAMMTDPIDGVGEIPTNVVDANADGIPDAGFAVIKADPDQLPVTPTNRSLGGDFIEGLNPETKTGDEYLFGFYGGLDDADDSGIVRWVSIRYSGFEIEVNSELQGLTPGGIGTGTQLEWIESILSSDDGFEFFGGKNDTRYIFSHHISDDSFDGDEGYRGVNQFWSVIQPDGSSLLGIGAADEVFEWDGSERAFVSALSLGKAIPETNLTVHNMTVLTNPNAGGAQIDGDEGISITLRGTTFDSNGSAKGVFDFDNDTATGAGLLTFEDVFYSSLSIGNTSPEAPGSTSTFEASIVMGNSPYVAGGIDQRLKTTSGAYNNAVGATPVGLSYAPYAAAQRQNTLTRGWTLIDAGGSNAAVGVSRVVVEGAVNNSVSSRPAIAFDAPAGSNADTIYHIYRSTNRSSWVPAATIKDGSVAAPGALGADAIGTANRLGFNDDAGPALAAGSPVYYYVVAN